MACCNVLSCGVPQPLNHSSLSLTHWLWLCPSCFLSLVPVCLCVGVQADQGIETDEAVKVKLEDWQAYFRDVKPLPKEVKGKGKKK